MDSFERQVGHLPAAFAVTGGDQHRLVYANAAFRQLIAPDGHLLVGHPIAPAVGLRDASGLRALLDRAFRTGIVSRNRRIDLPGQGAARFRCTVWPDVNTAGETDHVVIEVRAATQADLKLGLQRQMAERLLLSALRERDTAAAAERLSRAATFLDSESRRLAGSLDEVATLTAMNGMALPHLGAWCIVDTLDEDDTMHRLAIIHPDPTKQAILEGLDGHWMPEPADEFGLPAALRSAMPTLINDDVDSAFASAAQDPEILGALRALGVGALLTVPLVIRDRLIGAVTFVSDRHGQVFTPDDVKLAEDLGSRSAIALDRARLYGDAVALRVRAEEASEAKSAFLGMMSHELRTPLNAIGGYVDLIDMELRGPVTEAQHSDLRRIRANQQYLTGLISDLLNFTTIRSGRLGYDLGDMIARDIVAASVALLEPLIAQKRLTFDGITCDPDIVAHGDREKVIQILVNLLANGIKFTLPGGRLSIDCEATEDVVNLRVSDSGIGIPADKLALIFDPFVQVRNSPMRSEGEIGQGGIGLGLAISRDLARAMDGDLTVQSVLGKGSRFTLTLPRGSSALRAGNGATLSGSLDGASGTGSRLA